MFIYLFLLPKIKSSLRSDNTLGVGKYSEVPNFNPIFKVSFVKKI